jgi:hypothetical protein
MGANVAKEMGQDQFCETTIGFSNSANGEKWKLVRVCATVCAYASRALRHHALKEPVCSASFGCPCRRSSLSRCVAVACCCCCWCCDCWHRRWSSSSLLPPLPPPPPPPPPSSLMPSSRRQQNVLVSGVQPPHDERGPGGGHCRRRAVRRAQEHRRHRRRFLRRPRLRRQHEGEVHSHALLLRRRRFFGARSSFGWLWSRLSFWRRWRRCLWSPLWHARVPARPHGRRRRRRRRRLRRRRRRLPTRTIQATINRNGTHRAANQPTNTQRRPP